MPVVPRSIRCSYRLAEQAVLQHVLQHYKKRATSISATGRCDWWPDQDSRLLLPGLKP